MEKYTRHYIFIDPNDINCNLDTHPNLLKIKQIHNEHYKNGEHILYWGYNDIANLLKTYDTELYELFLKINYNYAALLADIGRYLILYYHGGIYHDIKCISNTQFDIYLSNLDKKITFIAEVSPFDTARTRNGNIVSLYKNHPLLNELLQEIKKRLILAHTNKDKGPSAMIAIGSTTYNIVIFKKYGSDTVIKEIMQPTYLCCDKRIYDLTPVRWQKVYEFIFQY